MRSAKKKLFESIIETFSHTMPDAESELKFDSPYQLLIAVMLSAQCTDKRVNMTTPALFSHFPDVLSLSKASHEEILGLIKSISYPNSKATHILEAAQKIVQDFHGEIPTSIEDLMTLPGVGRKTANVVASITWGEPVIAVDTHVFRVSRRIGLSSGKTPLAVEKDLEEGFPPELRPRAHHWLILHGRYTCTAIKPRCESCTLASLCKYHKASTRRTAA
ncbi:MAG TPA: endonuclease III [Rikenellaceae bacterium]|nr:endonuclease III [Rikenellaceae bacterium]